jgi:cell division protein ZapA
VATVSITIDGKTFRMACDDGQEAHLESLARHVDDRVKTMRQSFGEIGDLRLTVMAALMIADEVHEARETARTSEAVMAAREAALADATSAHSGRDREIAASLDALAGRVERITRMLSGREAE